MQFLYPKVLWALFSLAIPIIIHLFNFRRYKTVYFSNVAFLQNIRKETKSRSNLKNLLILLARMLAIACIVIVFAQPYRVTEKHASIAETSYVAVYIDNSFSMDAEGKYGVLLESAKVKAKELTGMFPQNTKYLLLTNEFSLMHQRFVSSEQFIDWISQITSTHVVRNLHEVMDKISAQLPEKDSNSVNTVFLLSDFQKNLLPGKFKNLTQNLKIVALPFYNETKGNLYIDSVWFETPGHYKGKQENIHVRIQNLSNETFTEIPVQFFINDSIKSSILVNIEASGSKDIVIPFTQWNSGFFKAYVDISDYPITFDNKLFFDFEIEDRKSVLLINGAKVEKFLEALFKEDENILATSVEANSIPFNTFTNYQTIILNEFENLSSGLINELVEYLNQGGSLVFIPDAQGNIESYNALFENIGLITLAEYLEQEGNIKGIDLQNELFKSAFNTDLSEVRMPNYKGFYNLTMQKRANAKVLFKSESDNPLVIKMPLGKGQCYISALPFNSKNTDFAIHPLFVPLFYNLVLFSSSPSEPYYWLKPGLFTRVARKNSSEGVVSLMEESTAKELRPKYNITHQDLVVFPTVEHLSAGHYSLKLGDVFHNTISYNFDRAESDISYFNKDEIRELFEGVSEYEIQIIDANGKNLSKIIQQQSLGKPLSILFLWLVIVALVSEMALIRYLK
jgi:hypothetical protein